MFLRRDDRRGNFRPFHQFVLVEVTQFEAGYQQAFQTDVYLLLTDFSALNGCGQHPVCRSALQIGSVVHGFGRSGSQVLRHVMQFGQEVAYGPAIAGNQSLEAPFVAQYLAFEAGIAATRLSVDALVGTHHFCHITLLHQCLEGWQVGFPQVACRQLLHVEGVAVPFRSAMYGKVLRTSQQFLVFRRSQQAGLAVVVRLSL